MNDSPKIVVLMYHRIGKAQNEWESRYTISANNFAEHMQALQYKGFTAIRIDELLNWIETGSALPRNAIIITFDDGFKGIYEHAFPILQKLNWSFTVFLVSDLIGEHDYWTRNLNPDGITYPLLNLDEILEMQQNGVCFESHTCNHPNLTKLSNNDLKDQLCRSRQNLSQILSEDIQYIAYPFGDVDDRVENATIASGYRAAFTTQPGFNRQNINPFRLRRLDIYGTDTSQMLLRKIKFGTNDGSLAQVFKYYLNRCITLIVGEKQ